MFLEKTNSLLPWLPTWTTGDLIVGKLNPLFQSGSSLLQDGDLALYLSIYAASIILFAGVYFMWKMLFTLTGAKSYIDRNED